VNADDMIMQMAIRDPIIDSEVHLMDFYLLKYTLEGEYVSIEPLDT